MLQDKFTPRKNNAYTDALLGEKVVPRRNIIRVYVVHVCGVSPGCPQRVTPRPWQYDEELLQHSLRFKNEDAYPSFLLFQAGMNETLFLKNDSSAFMSHVPYEGAATNTTSTTTTALNATSECEFWRDELLPPHLTGKSWNSDGTW